jgi:hypothetical protein
LKKGCDKGDNCKFIHDKTICKNYFFDANCKRGDNCKFKHIKNEFKPKLNEKLNKNKIKNTTNFNPSYQDADMNLLVSIPNENVCYNNNDLIVVPNFLLENSENELYNKLLNEIKESNIEEDKLWKLWHGDNHLIADDNINWKDKVPTFHFILNKIEEHFHMKIVSTRLNYYKNTNDWKPFHHDAAAIKEHVAENQNFTVGISLGYTRSISFENARNKTTISIPLKNCSAYGFAKEINIKWKHGIPKIDPNKFINEGRISIIAWGKVNDY